MKVVAKDVWGHGPNDILIVSEDSFVFGPVKRTELYKDGCGWAKVHIDISKEEAKALIVSLQQGHRIC